MKDGTVPGEAMTREELEAENARLRALLERAGAQAARQRLLAARNDADHLARLSDSRAEAAGYLRHLQEVQNRETDPDGIDDGQDDARREAGEPAGELARQLQAARLLARTTEERLALVFEASGSIGWWDWDVPADRLYANASFARMFGVDPEAGALGMPLSSYVDGIHPEDREWVGARIGEVLASGGGFAEEYRLCHADGTVIWIYARGHCYLDDAGRPLRYPGVAIDITERKDSERRKTALVELGDRLREVGDVQSVAFIAAEITARVLDATRAGIGTVDRAGELVTIQSDWHVPGVASLAGLHRFRDYGSFVDDLKRGEAVIIGDVTTDPRTAANAEALRRIGVQVLVNLPIVEHGRLVSLIFVHHDRPRLWTQAEINFLKTVGDRTLAAIERLRAEEQQALLNRELGHRLKNNLAMVQAIVAQTLRNAPDLDTARTSLSNRLMTLGRAHELLLSGRIDATDIRAVTNGTLALHDDGEGRIELSGPSVDIGSAAALSLALVLHELATNAAKYGALSAPGGRIEIDWWVEDTAGEERLVFTWTEKNGPPVAPPARRGFGSRLIERGLAGAMSGEVALEYRPEGLRCRLVAPLSGLQGED